MSASRSVYKIFRSILFSAVLVVIGFFACLYMVLSVPAVQNKLRRLAETELSEFFGGKVEIGELLIYPFNEVRLYEVSIYSPSGERCISVGRLGAGISLWPLVSDGRIEVSYAEIISLDAAISQAQEDAPLNIDFIIKAFAPMERNKPPARFDVVLRNIVIRKSRVSFDRLYLPEVSEKGRIDFNHLVLSDFRADIALPVLKNDDIQLDLRRLAFTEKCGLNVNNLAFNAAYTPEALLLSDFRMRLADSEISLNDQRIPLPRNTDTAEFFKNTDFSVKLIVHPLVPSDVSCFYPPLETFSDPCSLTLRLEGCVHDFDVTTLKFEDLRNNSSLNLSGNCCNLPDFKDAVFSLTECGLRARNDFVQKVLDIVPDLDNEVKKRLAMVGDVELSIKGNMNVVSGTADFETELVSSCGGLSASGLLKGIFSNNIDLGFSLSGRDLNLQELLNDARLGLTEIESKGHLSFAGRDVTGNVEAYIPYFDWSGNRFENFSLSASKEGRRVNANFDVIDSRIDLSSQASFNIAGPSSELVLDTDVRYLYPMYLGAKGFKAKDVVSGVISADLMGNSPDNFTGFAGLTDISFNGFDRKLNISEISVSGEVSGERREYSIASDFLNGNIRGTMKPTAVVHAVKKMLAEALPAFFDNPETLAYDSDSQLEYDFTIAPDDNIFSLVKAPVRPGVPVRIRGNFGTGGNAMALDIDAPFLIQGKNKLLRNTSLSFVRNSGEAPRLSASSDIPMKNDRTLFNIDVSALADSVALTLDWEGVQVKENNGRIGLDALFDRDHFRHACNASVRIKPSGFSLHDAQWNIAPALIKYKDNSLDVDGLKISHGNQFVDIYGRGSASASDVLNVNLSGIDLEYIFGILNIDHVDFGGIATGHAMVSSLFSKTPVACTNGLFVKNLAYNGYVLGDGQLESHWDNRQKMVAINADIDGPAKSSATVRGGVYVTRDSLSFDFGADHLDIRFLQPFMSGFTSSVSGHASGNVKLFGTFSDIDLTGDVHADDLTLRVEQTNVSYHGADSLFFRPGKILIPQMRLYDRYDNSCLFAGEVRHNYLKEASFYFNLSDARKLLVYDTDSRDNDIWYGRIFANGSAALKGAPGFVSLSAEMSTAPDSEFTFVLDETEEAAEYTFLTFSDRRKAERRELEVEETFEQKFLSSPSLQVQETPTTFLLNLALDVNPAARMIIVMDPKAGDKITAKGSGALQMRYNTSSDDFSIYGKYTLQDGWYNFSLQDLILKNFKIESGSNINFNGDPMRGILDITAAYRVNTNLKDLDNSFESDPDLKRTFVPVDALLKVSGDIHAPEIKFDIALPTVTSEVERKVRSIISTEDMLNRQVIYLLALNRFYTPEYMGASQGGEIASVASSTLSSQVQNIIGSLTDGFTLAPSFKSEKSDLSDMEVDLALSSSFFDNRLLLNGNLGYRDKSSSQTTFVGDFDLEYLLSRDGKLRLKAYNHFNDASYYLKSSLTTQGIGIVYRKDFDDPLKFLKRLFRIRRKPDYKSPEPVSGKDEGKEKPDLEGAINQTSVKKDKKDKENVIIE